jgi:hypothetical protein
MGLQVSVEVLDATVAPELSKLKTCGAKSIRRGPNQFARYQYLVMLGPRKYKKHIHALLVVYFRRVDFARVEFNLGCKQLRTYISKIPHSNSQTRFYRLALCHFETCLLHLYAAVRCGTSISKSLNQPLTEDDDEKVLRDFCNRIKHFDEDILEGVKNKSHFQIVPVWITNLGLKCQLPKNKGTIELEFSRLRQMLLIVENECKNYCDILLEK